MDAEMSLSNLGGGVAIEKFAEELGRVVANILDPNTEATAKREILLRVALKPTSDRCMAAVAVATQAKLAPSTCFATQAFIGGGVAIEKFAGDPRQLTIGQFVRGAQDQAACPATDTAGDVAEEQP